MDTLHPLEIMIDCAHALYRSYRTQMTKMMLM